MELSAKTKTYFSTAVALWDAEFYIKVDDDVHVNLGEKVQFSLIFSFILDLWSVDTKNSFAIYLSFLFQIRIIGSTFLEMSILIFIEVV